jgi:hypothetical protein
VAHTTVRLHACSALQHVYVASSGTEALPACCSRAMNLKVKLLDQSVHEIDVDPNVSDDTRMLR